MIIIDCEFQNYRKYDIMIEVKKMNETRVYEDNYRAVFTRQEDFLSCINRIGNNSFWERRKSKIRSPPKAWRTRGAQPTEAFPKSVAKTPFQQSK